MRPFGPKIAPATVERTRIVCFLSNMSPPHAVQRRMRALEDEIKDPVTGFQAWLEEAGHSEPNDPTAAALATASISGVPSVRMVLTKGTDERGIRFFTNEESQKGQELRENPVAAMCFHWKSLRRQVRFEGAISLLDRSEVDEYFHSRGRGSQIAAAVSHQSQTLDSRSDLDRAVQEYVAQLGDAEVPLPEHWTGFLLKPGSVEFWRDGKDRLHDRLRFTREGEGWRAQRLYP